MARVSKASLDAAWVLSDQIGQAYSRILACTEHSLADEENSVSEFVALAILASFPKGLTQSDWGRHQGVSRQRAHVITGKLQAQGLVDVVRHGRASTISLSPLGVAHVKKVKPKASRALAGEFGNLTTSEIEELSLLLEKMLAAS